MDRREKRSRERLRKALISLLHEQDYLDIKVREIAERGDCGIATFYRQYKNKEDLLQDVILHFPDFVNFPAYQEQQSITYLIDPKHHSLLLPLVQYIHSERVFMRRLLLSPLSTLILEAFYRLTIQRVSTNTPEWTEKEVYMIAGSVVGNIHQWLLLDLPYTPEEVASMIHLSSIYGVLIQRESFSHVRDEIRVNLSSGAQH